MFASAASLLRALRLGPTTSAAQLLASRQLLGALSLWQQLQAAILQSWNFGACR